MNERFFMKADTAAAVQSASIEVPDCCLDRSLLDVLLGKSLAEAKGSDGRWHLMYKGVKIILSLRFFESDGLKGSGFRFAKTLREIYEMVLRGWCFLPGVTVIHSPTAG